MLALVIYDIHDDKQRTRLSKLLQSFGLTRVQYSAFRGELSPHDRMVLAKKVQKFVEDEVDCIFIIPLCGRCLGTAEVVSASGKELVSDTSVDIV